MYAVVYDGVVKGTHDTLESARAHFMRHNTRGSMPGGMEGYLRENGFYQKDKFAVLDISSETLKQIVEGTRRPPKQFLYRIVMSLEQIRGAYDMAIRMHRAAKLGSILDGGGPVG